MTERVLSTPIEVSLLETADINELDPILRRHVRNSGAVDEEEVAAIKSWMAGQPDSENGNRTRTYIVAKEAGRVVGCVGVTQAAQYHLEHHGTLANETAELVNFFVDGNSQGKGIGRKLFDSVVTHARASGKKHLVLDSGPRYEKAWPVYTKIFGYPGSTIPNLYGPNRHAQTWKLDLI